MSENYAYAQGPVKPATAEDLVRDASGITKPNLHRRINNDLTVLGEDEVEKDTYLLTVQGTNSFRNTEHYYHDEDSNDSEIP